MAQLTNRQPLTENEMITLKREGQNGFWHGRDANGDLIIKNRYRFDAQMFLKTAGFTWTMDYSNGS